MVSKLKKCLGIESMQTPQGRLHAIQLVNSIFLLVGILMSWRLWTSNRSFPTIPVFSFLSPWPNWIELSFLGLLLLCLLGTVFRKTVFYSGIGIVVLLVFSVMADQVRLQPWVYIYAIVQLILVYYYYRLRGGGNLTQEALYALNCIRPIPIGVYFWAGYYKLNYKFIHETFPWFISPIESLIFWDIGTWTEIIVPISVALFEAALGIGLLFNRTRHLVLYLITVLHLFILLMLGPIGLNWNTIIWPWNIYMVLFCYLLFFKIDSSVNFSLILLSKKRLQQLILLLFILMPSLYHYGLWDRYLSFALYSGDPPVGGIIFGRPIRKLLPKYLDDRIDSRAGHYAFLPVFWSLAEFNVPIPSEIRIFRGIKNSLCKQMIGKLGYETIGLTLYGRPNVLTGKRYFTYERCGEELANWKYTAIPNLLGQKEIGEESEKEKSD